jgi:hypothetical protein
MLQGSKRGEEVSMSHDIPQPQTAGHMKDLNQFEKADSPLPAVCVISRN